MFNAYMYPYIMFNCVGSGKSGNTVVHNAEQMTLIISLDKIMHNKVERFFLNVQINLKSNCNC